jgi:hypothetical protein
MPLRQALEYIADDPDALFCETAHRETEPHLSESAVAFRLGQLIGLLHEQILIRALLGSALGGLGRSPTEGLVIGIVAALICGAAFDGFRHGWRALTACVFLPGIPVLLVTVPAATLGGSLHQFIGSGVAAALAGALAAAISSVLMVTSPRLCWLLSFSAAFIFAARCNERLEGESGYVGWFVVAICSALVASLYGELARYYRAGIDLLVPSRDSQPEEE